MSFGSEITAPARYRVRDDDFTGTLHEISKKRAYANGQGCLRNIVVAVDGLYNQIAYVPMIVFGVEAESLDPDRDIGRKISCTARLQTSQYQDRNGVMRWSVSFVVTRMALEPIKIKATGADAEEGMDPLSYNDFSEDLPF